LRIFGIVYEISKRRVVPWSEDHRVPLFPALLYLRGRGDEPVPEATGNWIPSRNRTQLGAYQVRNGGSEPDRSRDTTNELDTIQVAVAPPRPKAGRSGREASHHAERANATPVVLNWEESRAFLDAFETLRVAPERARRAVESWAS
jgi:hypothetical protein